MAGARSAGGRPVLAGRVALVGTVLLLAALSFGSRLPCLLDPAATGPAAALPGCHADLEAMWLYRGLREGYVPYLQPFPDPRSGQLVTVEYPVLIGLLMWLAALPGSYVVFVALGTLFGAAAAVGIALVLRRWCGGRAWLWAAAPALAFYLAYNYDALPSLTVIGALALVAGRDPLEAGRTRPLLAAALLGGGGALKLYPLLLVLPLALWLLFGRPGTGQAPLRTRLARASGVAGVAAGTFVALNLPFLLANPGGWWLPYTFQATRVIDESTFSLWYVAGLFLPGVGAAGWLQASAVATALAIALAAVAGWLLARRAGAYPLAGSSVTVLVAYLLANKVHSPQYILWLLPLLVFAGLGARELWAYLAIDVAMFAGLWLALATGAGWLLGVLLLLTLVRAGYLVWVAVRAASLSGPAGPA